MTITALAPASDQPPRRLRLLKVVVQPVFVIDDGDSLTEQPGQPVTVTAAQWPDFGSTAFSAAEMADLQQQLNAAPTDS